MDVASNICNDFRVLRVDDLGKYLGVPFFYQRVSESTFSFVLDKVHNKLNGWDATSLSLARRITLDKSVLLTIPSYFMNTVRLPTSLCEKIEKVARDFI